MAPFLPKCGLLTSLPPVTAIYTGLLNCTMYQYTPSASTHWGHKLQGRKMCFPLIYILFDCPFSDISSPQLQPIVKAAELAKETK